MARNEGHEILFTPPYHSDLKPIELLWALIKGNIGRSYSLGITLTEVEEKLKNEFYLICSEVAQKLIGSMIESINAKIYIDDNGESNNLETESESGAETLSETGKTTETESD